MTIGQAAYIIKDTFIHIPCQQDDDLFTPTMRRCVSDSELASVCPSPQDRGMAVARAEGVRSSPESDAQDPASVSEDCGEVQRQTGSLATAPPPQGEMEQKTTIILRNLPYWLLPEALDVILRSESLGRQYDFLYMPMDFSTKQNRGYAFLNAITPAAAHHFFQSLNGFAKWDHKSPKVMKVEWGRIQGLEHNIMRYMWSPVMIANVLETFKPRLFKKGVPVPFAGGHSAL